MAELICDTSPLQYLHQIGQLDLLRQMSERIVVPPAVADELASGKAAGFNVPLLGDHAWIMMRSPASALAERLIADLGRGETEVLMLALESPASVAVLDDAMARRVALTLGINVSGTLGLLVDAKAMRLVPAVRPLLDRLQELGFWVSRRARSLVLRKAGEERL